MIDAEHTDDNNRACLFLISLNKRMMFVCSILKELFPFAIIIINMLNTCANSILICSTVHFSIFDGIFFFSGWLIFFRNTYLARC